MELFCDKVEMLCDELEIFCDEMELFCVQKDLFWWTERAWSEKRNRVGHKIELFGGKKEILSQWQYGKVDDVEK